MLTIGIKTPTCGMMASRFLVTLLVILEGALQLAAQSVSVSNVTYSSASLFWDFVSVGAPIQSYQISVNCHMCFPIDVSGNISNYELTELKDNTPFRACVTPSSSLGIGTEQCVRFRTHLSPRTVGALCVGLFLVVSFFVLLVMDLMCRRHQIEVEDAKRDELLQQGWQTFKRSSTGRVAKKHSRASAGATISQAQDDGFENLGDVTLEEELTE